MRLVLFDRKAKPAPPFEGEETMRGLKLSKEEIHQFHRPKVLKLFAYGNLLVAVFYSILGTTGIIAIMFYDTAIGVRVSFTDMIELLQRSLLHSMGAGVALIFDHIMASIKEIIRMRRAEKIISSMPPD